LFLGLLIVWQLATFHKNHPVASYDDEPRVVILIISYPKNYQRRAVQRDHWLRALPSEYLYKYVVGDPDLLEWKDDERILFEEEMEKEQDIVIVRDYQESYQTIGEKVYWGIDWASKFQYDPSLPYRSQYIVKTDDDILLRLDLLLKLFRTRLSTEKQVYYGQIFKGMKPARTTRSKYYVSEEEYAGDEFPPYACGAFYFITMDLARNVSQLYKTPDFKLFKLEDVHMGMLMDQLQVEAEDNKGTFECSIHYVPHNETLFVHDYTGY
jgi:hypothetical protein